jgi:hypothetical protein
MSPIIRILITAGGLISALLPAATFAKTAEPVSPKITETQEPDKKAEYLETKRYAPCPASVIFPDGRQVCLGLPGLPGSEVQSYDPNE